MFLEKIKNIFKSKEKKVDNPNIVIVEGIEGYWHYHLSKEKEYLALCGNNHVMDTHMTLGQWGVPFGHLLHAKATELVSKQSSCLKQ
ncbi:MAG: hypothetical protein AABY32_00835 [Nanoarchaeota archaeon]